MSDTLFDNVFVWSLGIPLLVMTVSAWMVYDVKTTSKQSLIISVMLIPFSPIIYIYRFCVSICKSWADLPDTDNPAPNEAVKKEMES